MNKQLVYRIEDSNAKKGLVYEGPYLNNYGGSVQWREHSHDSKKHPTCDKDKTLVRSFNRHQKESGSKFKNTDFYCGFTSLDQIKKWFTEKELWNLQMLGFVLTIYEASVVISSAKQAIFIPKKGKKRKVVKLPLS